ncbi:MAG TPA: amidase [Burkholderiales bacterium]|nr:amidase [Burkholderiales bacterium]
MDSPCSLTIAELAALIEARKLSPVELVNAYLQRIDALDPRLNAFITVTGELALQQARQAEAAIAAGKYRGPLHGIPFGLKDMFETRGIRTTAHSRVLEHHVPAADASVVTRLYDAGAVLLGKLATHEFAHGGPSFDLPWPPARNPWQPDHYTGGSSSGSAAAVAAGMVAGALGTDTGGSIRSPSWLCGTAGFKPTFGLVSRTGVIPFSESCDHAGPITWTVEDAAIVLQALAGHDPTDRCSAQRAVPDFRATLGAGIKGLRLGFVRHFSETDTKANPELLAAVEEALRVLRGLGATIEDVKVRPLMDLYAVRIVLTESELFSLHLCHLRERPGDYGEHFLSRCLPACLFTASDYLAAQRERRRILREMDALHRDFDALITIGAGPAPKLADHKSIGSADKWLKPGLGALASVTGAPALAQCCGFSRAGLPLGMQVIGRPWQDAEVLRIGHAYESATQWRRTRPKLQDAGLAPIDTGHDEVSLSHVEPAVRARALDCAARAGLALGERHQALLLESAPYALALASRVPRDHTDNDPMASRFMLD